MSDENKLWGIIFVGAILIILTLIGCITYYNVDLSEKIVESDNCVTKVMLASSSVDELERHILMTNCFKEN